MLQQGSRAEIEQDINYVVTGLDKLYSKSPVLKKDQVAKSSLQADTKVQSKVQKIKARLDTLKSEWFEQGRPIVRKAFTPLDQLVTEKDALAETMAWVDDISPKDWTKFNTLQHSIDGWKDKYMGLHNGTIRDKGLSEPSANIEKNLADLYTEIDDVVEGFRARVGILKRSAMDRVDAREVLAAESSSATASKSASSAAPSVSILPIAERAAQAVGAAGIIGKGKQQIEDALKQAGQAVTGTASSVSASASDRISILPIAERAAEAAGAAGIIGKGKQQVEDALHQASQAVVGTPSSSASGVRSAASDLISSASSVVHEATRSVVSAAGYTPSPEGVSEHAASIYNAASASIASVASAIPGTESAEAYLESIAAQVQVGAAAAYAQAQQAVGAASPENAGSFADQARSSASSVGQAVSSAIHEATRSIISAAGGTPSPEGVAEYAIAASASASSVVAEATRAIGNAVPSIDLDVESRASVASASVSSIGSVASASASSVGSVVSQAVHDGTRAAVRAVGATPSPESMNEHVESIYAQASASASSIGSVVAGAGPSVNGAGIWPGFASEASSLSSQISSLLAPTATPSPIASYLSNLSSAGASVGRGMLASGSDILDSLSSEMHTATRSLVKAAGGTAAPEGVAERVEDFWRRVEEMEGKVEEGVKKALGRDEL